MHPELAARHQIIKGKSLSENVVTAVTPVTELKSYGSNALDLRHLRVRLVPEESRATLFDGRVHAFAHVVAVDENEEVQPLVRKALRERRFVVRARGVLRHLHGERSVAQARSTLASTHGVVDAVGVHYRFRRTHVMAENGQVVQLAVAVLDMVAEQRFGAEADGFEARNRGTLIDGHLYAQLGQLKF